MSRRVFQLGDTGVTCQKTKILDIHEIKFQNFAPRLNSFGHFFEIQFSSKPPFPTNKRPQSHPVMKKYLPYSLILAAAATGLAHGAATAYTTPVGYVTKALPPGATTLVGLTVHNPTVAAGVLDAVTSTPAKTVTDNGVNFTTTLTAGQTYILELPDGTVQEIKSWTGSVLTTPDNITSKVVAGTTSYKLRPAATVSSVFGATNSIGLSPDTDGSLTGTDLVLVLNANNAFDTVYYFNDGAGTQGWFDDQGNPAGDKVIAYPDSFFVRRAAGASKSLVVSGEIKTNATGGSLVSGYNYVNAVAPTGLTLANSGLNSFLVPDADGSFTGTDFVLVPSGSVFLTAYYFNDGAGTQGWFDDQGNAADATVLDGGFLIKSNAGPKAYTVSVPTTYSSL
jgi:hypothetical protein